MKYILISLGLFIVGCVSVPHYDNFAYYEECSNSEAFYLYSTDDTTSQTIAFIPANTTFYTRTGHRHKYLKLYYGSHHGFAYNKKFHFRKVWHPMLPADLIVQQDHNYSLWESKDNTSPVSDSYPSPAGNSGKSVHVKGYYRKNGTYVHPYTRSAPSRRH